MVKSRRCASAAEIAAEPDDGVAPVGFDILAQRGHLEADAADHHRDGPVRDPASGWRGSRAPRSPFQNGLRQRRGGEVHVSPRQAQQRVADRTTDDAGLLAIAVEQIEQLPQGGMRQQARARKAAVRAQRS